MNRIEYDFVVERKLYLTANQHDVAFPDGAGDVKASWMDMTDVPHPERYYTRDAWLMDPETGVCSSRKVGLIGLHIVRKTPSRPQWIWSSFEHVDNVPPGVGKPLALNNGKGDAMPVSMPAVNKWRIPIPSPPPPYNVERVKPIDPRTQKTNLAYQKALTGTVWANYELVVTQWPVPRPPNLPSVDPAQNGKPANTFPGTGASTAFANTTMETFDQRTINTGCMNCHNATMGQTDFLWSLAVNAALAEQHADRKFSMKRPPSQLRELVRILESANANGGH